MNPHQTANIRTAANRWYDSNNESADVSTGICALADLAKAVKDHNEPELVSILGAVARVLSVYAEFGTDPDGEASTKLAFTLAEAGFKEPEDFEPLTEEEVKEVYAVWDETFRDDPSTAVDQMTEEWTDRDWRNEFDDYRSMGEAITEAAED